MMFTVSADHAPLPLLLLDDAHVCVQPYGMQAPAAGYGAPAAPSYGSSTDEVCKLSH